MSLFLELKRRNVFRVAAAYLAGAWLLIQILETLLPIFGSSETAARWVVILLGIGFIPAVILAWVFEWTPEGLQKDSEVDHESAPEISAAKRFDRIIIVVLALGIGYFAVDKFVLDPARDAEQMEAVAEQARTEALTGAYGDRSIAVLPFADLSPEGDQEYFSDGISEELLNLLAKIPELRVISRSSAFSFKGQNIHIPTVAEQLNVAHVLEGSVRKAGNRIRITAQLIDGATDTHLWSENFDREMDDIFAIQDEIAAAVVEQLKITLLGDLPHARVVDPVSWELTLQARYFYNRRNPGDWQQAFDLLEQAIAIDDSNAAAWTRISPLYMLLFDPPRMEESRHAKTRALELDPDNPEAIIRHIWLLEEDGEFSKAEAELRRAEALAQNDAWSMGVLASRAEQSREWERAVMLYQQAIALDPLHIRNLTGLGNTYWLMGRRDLARQTYERALEIAPNSTAAVFPMAIMKLADGEPEQALKLGEKIPEQSPASLVNLRDIVLSMAYFDLGDMEASNAALLRLEEGLQRTSEHVHIAAVYGWRGETDLAFEWISRAFEAQPDFYFEPNRYLGMEKLAADPRWADIESRLEANRP